MNAFAQKNLEKASGYIFQQASSMAGNTTYEDIPAVMMGAFATAAQSVPLMELGFYALSAGVLLLSWTTRSASSDPSAAAHRLGLSVGRLAPTFNVGSFLVFAALYFGASLSSWALLCLAVLTCPKPIEWDFIGSILKSTFFGTSVKAETFMTDLLRIARELGARQGLPQDAMPDLIKFELPFGAPVFLLLDARHVHFTHVAPSCELFESLAGDWFLGPNLLTSKSPPLKNPQWLLHRALTSPINTDRNGIDSMMGRMIVQALTVFSDLSRGLRKKHGSVIDLCDEFENIMVAAHQSAIFGHAYTDRYPNIAADINYTAAKYFCLSNTVNMKAWMPWELIPFIRARKRVYDSILWGIEHSDTPLVAIFTTAHKEGKLNREELVGTFLLFTYALAPSRTVVYALALLSSLPTEQDRIAKEVRTRLIPLVNEKTGEVDPARVGTWMKDLDDMDNLKRCVRETLRLYPGVPLLIPQVAARDLRMGSWDVSKGAIIFTSPFLSHRDRNAHPNPDMYDPNRGLETGAPLPDGTTTFFPFSIGPRSCAGQFYSELFVQGAVAIALQDHEFEAKGPVPPPAMVAFCQPMAPAYARVTAPPSVGKKQQPQVSTPSVSVNLPVASSECEVDAPRLENVDVITILFASTHGTSRAFADRLARSLQESDVATLEPAPSIRVCDAARYHSPELARESLVIFLVSTFGHNQPPYSGTALKAFVNDPGTKLPGLTYTVFALGNSVYPSFCSFGKLFDKRLVEVGARRLMPVTLCDEIEDQEGAFVDFLDRVTNVLYSSLEGNPTSPASVLPPSSGAPSTGQPSAKKTKSAKNHKIDTQSVKGEHNPGRRFRLVELGRGRVGRQRGDINVSEGSPKGTRDNPVEFQVLGNECLRPDTTLAQVRNVALRTPADGSISYQPGDLFGVYPVNRLDLVVSLARRLGIQDLDLEFELQLLSSEKVQLQSPFPERMTYWLALTSYLAIQRVPQPHILKILQQYTGDSEEADWLGMLARGGPKYTEWALGSHSLLETLYQVPSCKPDVGHLFESLPHLQPRMYSLSSSLLYRSGEAHLTVAEVLYQSNEHVWRRGVCSTFLGTERMIPSSAADDRQKLLGFVMPNPGFHLPEDVRTPIIMIGMGSGIAPFRSFWQERLARAKDTKNGGQLGDALLYVGFQSKVNSCYLDEMHEAKAGGGISKVRVVFSREGERKYVTHALAEDQWSLWHNYLSQGAVVYICGTIDAANDVRSTMLDVIKEAGGMSEHEAAAWLESARDEGRYKEEVFGESTQSYSKTRMEARLRKARSMLRAAFALLGAKGIQRILESAPPEV